MNATSLEYREAFLQVLNNKDKSRKQGFVVFVHGSEDLAPLEELCFDTTQGYNHCLTARYGARQGYVLKPLIQQFVQEAQMYLTDSPNPVQSQSAPTSSGVSPWTGQFRPPPSQDDWLSLLQHLKSLGPDPFNIELEHFFSVMNSALRVGQRLVLFCELADLSKDCKLEDIGFSQSFVDQLSYQLPERVGIVLSGLPAGLELSGLGPSFLNIEVDAKYGAPGTAPARSQPLRNDTPRGEDRLTITSEVNALTDAIAGKDMDPPLVVGILGGWGAGKSFILHLLQERLRFIRNQDLSDVEVRMANPYVGHPYLVHFDAWTYAKADLWASLMERILFDLDQQLNLEQVVAPLGILEKGFDLWEIIANSSPEQLKALKEKLGEEAMRLITEWKQGGETASALWKALEGLRTKELENLQKAKDELEKKQKENADALLKAQIDADQKLLEQKQKFDRELAEKQQAQKDLLAPKQAALESAKAKVKSEVDSEMQIEARKEAWKPMVGEIRKFFGSLADRAMQKSGDAPDSIGDVEKELKLFTKYLAGLGKSPASLAFLGFAIVSALGTWYLTQFQTQAMVPMLASYTGMVSGALASLYTALTKVNRWFEDEQSRYQAQLETIRGEKALERETREEAKREALVRPLERDIERIQAASDVEIKAFEETSKEQLKNQQVQAEKQLAEQKQAAQTEIRQLEEQVAEHERRAGIPGQSKSLTDLIQKRIASGYYQERLGIVHQVQSDLQEITEALIPPAGHDQTLFPRGAPRIIILIDDLDRCPPRQVVQVLEAAQLLVKTRLFVVVLAMDVRYVTRALEKEYEGILVHEGNPSGLDYAEKIVQIPYRVRPIAPSAMTAYLRSQMVVHEVAAGHGLPAGSAYAAERNLWAAITPPGHASTRVNENLPPEIQEFEQEELDLMAKAAGAVEISPRATKRLVNVMKLIKNIWYRRGMEVPGVPVKRAITLLLSLSAAYPEALARVLDELERTFRDETKFDPQRSLREALQSAIDNWSTREGISGDWMEVTHLIHVESLLDASLTLEMLGLDNLQIVRSFSFLGEVDMPLVEKLQKYAVEVQSSSNGKQAALPLKSTTTRSRKKAGSG